MRLVHLADLHLGFRQFHRLTPAGINQRETDVADAFRRAIDRTIELEPGIIVIAGDVFHSVRPMNPAIVSAFREFQRLVQALPRTPIVMVAGNHDQPRATETGCILRLFSRLGIHVVVDAPERLSFPEHELSVLAVPEMAGRIPELAPDPDARRNVLVLHGEVAGVLPPHIAASERAAIEIPREALHAADWSYIALGHLHVHRPVASNAYYSGSIEYTSSNPWGELQEERDAGLPGKGFIERDLESGSHIFHHIPSNRRLVDLAAIHARGMTAEELDTAIRERMEGCDGGIDDCVVRLVVRDVPRHIVRELDHRALRDYKRRALHLNLDARRPELIRESASGAPGRRATLMELVESYLGRRVLDADLDRAALVQLGVQYLRDADADADQAAATATAAG